MPAIIINFIAVAIGGAIGSMIRYGVSLLYSGTHSVLGLSTITVNLIGSFLIGFLYALSSNFYFSPAIRLFLFVGLLGGFTTFSSFALETIETGKEFGLQPAIITILLNNVGGIVLAYMGILIGNKIFN
ncbi:MAG: fluoride efflux transporter CrcB [Muribaculaceae bacterium]|nr:fluoride efflux transporter CrcB [Muribaculaceae bacterium]